MLGVNLVTFEREQKTYVFMKCYLNNFNNSIGQGEYPIESAAKMFEDIQEMTKDLKLTQARKLFYTTILPNNSYKKYDEVGLLIMKKFITQKIKEANKHYNNIEQIINKNNATQITTPNQTNIQ